MREMKSWKNEISKKHARAAGAWLLLPLLVLVLLKTDCLLLLSRSYPSSAMLRAAIRFPKATDSAVEAPPSPTSSDETAGEGVDGIKDVEAPSSKLSCNFSSIRMDICLLEGDVRVHGKLAVVYMDASSNDSYRPENGTVKIRPHTRKWEPMDNVHEVTIHSSAMDNALPPCTITHDVPAVVFSAIVLNANYYHGMDDTILPLYITARQYDGRVMFLATDYNRKGVSRFRQILGALSMYPIVDLDADDTVRCFPSVHVGIESHDDLGINQALSRNGYRMIDFRSFLRSVFSLKRASTAPTEFSLGQRPRLLMILRRHTRELTNEKEAIAVATDIGFDVVAAGPEMVRDMAQFAQVVNTCDVIMGVHGAGLTNMLFLPDNGTVMQIIPYGGIKWSCWHIFGRPVPGMGLRYVEYEATAEETTLKDVYPREHAVFTDLDSIHNQSFTYAWKIFFNGQNVTLDIDRFKGVMQELYQSVTIA